MHQREMAAIAGRVKRRRGLRDVLTDDRDIADLAIALAQLVVSEADRARVVSGFRLLQRAAVQGDGARLIAARRRQAAVQTPERGEVAGRDRVAETVRRAAQGGSGLIEIILQQTRFGQRGADRQFGVARQRRRAKHGREHLRRFRIRGRVRARCSPWR